jgi:predicted nucleic acid-binding Zn ribbon protein
MHHDAPKSAAAVLRSLLDGMDCGGRILQNMAPAFWPLVAGEAVARVCIAEEVRDGILYVRTPGSTWSQELSLLKHTIVPRINAMIGAPAIKDIKFRVGGPPIAEGPHDRPTPSAEELAQVELTEDDRKALEKAMREADAIGDPAIRAATERLVARACRLRRWRLLHGWRECPSCGALYDDAGPACTLCMASK